MDFVHKVFRILSEHCTDTNKVNALLQDNCASQSLLMCVLQQVVRAEKVDIRQRERVVSVLQPYWPKIAALLLYGAPLRSDFLISAALSQCMRFIMQSGLDINGPLHVWRSQLSKPIRWEHAAEHTATAPTLATTHDVMHVETSASVEQTGNKTSNGAVSSLGHHGIAAADSTGQALAVHVQLCQFAAQLNAHSISYGDHLGQPDVRITVSTVNTSTATDSQQQHGSCTQELFAHSFVLHNELAGVLRNMLESEMVTTECVHTADGPHVYTVLSFPHMSAAIFELVLWWVYAGRDVCYQQSLATVTELLCVANELLAEGLQQLWEVHLCLRRSETDPAVIAHLIESMHCSILSQMQRVCAQNDGADEDTGSVLSHLATLSAQYSCNTLHGVLLSDVYCASTVCTCITMCVATLQSALSMVLEVYTQHDIRLSDCIAGVIAFVSELQESHNPDAGMCLYTCAAEVEALLFALLCWQQRLVLRLQLLKYSGSCDVVLQLHPKCDESGVAAYGGAAEVRIEAHRAILAHSSPKLRGMIHFTLAQQSSGIERDTSCVHGHSGRLVLYMQGISEEALRALVQYIYTDSLPASTSTNFLFEMLGVADEHIMPALTEYVSELLVATLSCENSGRSFCLAQQYQLPLLRTFSALFVIKQYGGMELSGTDYCESSCELFAEAVFSLIFDTIT